MKDLDQDTQLFLAALDALSSKLDPPRRPQDAGAAECSPREIRTLKEIGQHDKLTMSKLALLIDVPLSTATRTVDKLVAKGFLERQKSADDGRIMEVRFASLGKQINRYIQKNRNKEAHNMLKKLSALERRRLLHQLEKLSKH